MRDLKIMYDARFCLAFCFVLLIDLEIMNEFRKVVNNFRANSDVVLLEQYKCEHNGKTEYGKSFDKNYWHRKKLIFELYKNYTKQDKPLIKWLLKEELKGFEFDIPVQTTDLCAFMLYKVMDFEDVYDLYEAKFATGTDAQVYVDIELVFGFGREQTKVFLKGKKSSQNQNKEILNAIEHYESNPNAKFKSREEYISYFENRKINMIKNDLEDWDNYEEWK